MEMLDNFYARKYETDINRKMLYYTYDFPRKEVEEYIQATLAISIDDFIKYDIEMQTAESIFPKDVFQFSLLELATDHICNVLNEAGNPGVTFVEAGKLLLNDGVTRNEMAYIKYGENHLKTAEALGLLYELTRTYFVSCIGLISTEMGAEERKKLNTRLFLRNKFIARLIKASSVADVDMRQFLYMLSDSTYVRRKSNIKSVLRYLGESDEYDFSALFNRVHFS